MVDASSPEADRHRDTVLETLESLGAGDKAILTVFNKSDLVEDQPSLRKLVADTPNSCYISAAKADGVRYLMDRINETIKGLVTTMLVAIPYSRSELVAQCHEFGVVHSVDYGPEHILVRADLSHSLAGKLEEFQIV